MEKEKETKLKALSELKFESVGEEYVYLYEKLSFVFSGEKQNLQPPIEELRELYGNLVTESANYNNELEKRYEKTSIYWSDAQEKAIVEFLNETDEAEKNKIFSRHIYKPLRKLIENIIFTYKLFRPDVDITELQSDCMSFLITKIEKYNPKTGAKAFAYLGTIAKHYLMGEKRVAYKITKSNVDIDESMDEASSKPENIYHMDDDGGDDAYKEKDNVIFDEIIKRLQAEIVKPKMLPNDKKVGEAIIWIFTNHEMLKVYNKNLVYHLLKERTGLQTKEITYSLSRFKNYYKVFKQDFLKNMN